MNRREDWWLYVKRILADYPALARAEAAGEGLPRRQQRRLMALRYAIRQTRALPDGENRLRLVRMVYWEKTHTIAGAALRIPCAASTAGSWQAAFIRLVAEYLDLV